MRLACLILPVVLAVPAFAAIKTESVEYKDGDTLLEGYIAYDDASTDKRPGILIVHAWWGLGNQSKDTAKRLAELGYVGFAVDMYGKGVLAKTRDEAMKLSGPFREDRALMRRRVKAALETLKKNPLVDTSRIAALGYCFGGTTVLELARSGEPIQGVVSFHGGLNTPNVEDAKNIKTKVLVLHGADDPAVPQEEVLAFQDEMRKANVDWQMIAYGGAVHSFSDPEANSPPTSVYNEKAARRSWEAMKQFLSEIFAR
ncbi:MAG: dienelactone hydrolase family protein [Candidatus Hydrogenedentes bacterium]|nr:dienelactone hydrolase family protein [Candidatus Hydrogenedentota bacterium]